MCSKVAIVHSNPQGTKRVDVVQAGNSNSCRLRQVVRIKGQIEEHSVAGCDQTQLGVDAWA